MGSTKEVLQQITGKYGEDAFSPGDEVLDTARLPFGLFPLDLATGGGLPLGKMSIIYGPESSNKTNLAYKSLRMYQRRYHDRPCFFFDLENAFDHKWASKMGVDTKKLTIMKPDYAEQFVDQLDALLYAEDCGLVVVDSLAAMVTANEVDSSAEKMIVGGSALMTNKLMKKTVVALSRREKTLEPGQHAPTVIMINQIRYKIGVMFGDPETLPGGAGQKYHSAMTIRLYGKNIKDDKVSTSMPCRKKMTCVLKKWKVPVVSMQCELEMVMVPHKGLGVGVADDWNSVSSFMQAGGLIVKGDKKGWVMLGVEYPTLLAMRKAWVAEDLGKGKPSPDEVRDAIIADKLVDAVTGDGPVGDISEDSNK